MLSKEGHQTVTGPLLYLLSESEQSVHVNLTTPKNGIFYTFV
jgi:hypothetical protein